MQNMTDAPSLTSAQLRDLEAELRRELARIERSIRARAGSSEAAQSGSYQDAGTDADAAGHAAVATVLEGRAAAHHAAVVDALDRLARGSYGTCVSCQRTIPYGRLLAMPETAHCVACGVRG
jgi:RNA polymerase-binding transcription factor DksA